MSVGYVGDQLGTVTSPVRTDPTGTTTQPVSFAAPTSSAVTSVTASITTVTLLAANASRKGAIFYNDSSSDVRVKLGATASANSFTTVMGPQTFWALPFPGYTGIVDAIWDTATGNMRVTELT